MFRGGPSWICTGFIFGLIGSSFVNCSFAIRNEACLPVMEMSFHPLMEPYFFPRHFPMEENTWPSLCRFLTYISIVRQYPVKSCALMLRPVHILMPQRTLPPKEMHEWKFEAVSDYGVVTWRQISGLIARKISCRLKPGDEVRIGDKFGFDIFWITHGSVSPEQGRNYWPNPAKTLKRVSH